MTDGGIANFLQGRRGIERATGGGGSRDVACCEGRSKRPGAYSVFHCSSPVSKRVQTSEARRADISDDAYMSMESPPLAKLKPPDCCGCWGAPKPNVLPWGWPAVSVSAMPSSSSEKYFSMMLYAFM